MADDDELFVKTSNSNPQVPFRKSQHELSVQRKAIEARLEQDQQNLQSFKDILAKGNSLCESMITCVNSFESRLDRLQSAVLPIYEDTVALTKKKDGMQEVLKCLADVMVFYNLTDQIKIIKQGVHQFNDFEAYLVAVDEVLAAHDFFSKERPDSMELANVADSAALGVEKVSELYRNCVQTLLKVYSDDDLVKLRDPELDSAEDIAYAQAPEDVKFLLSSIGKWLHEKAKEESFALAYGKVRSQVLEQTLSQYRPKGSTSQLQTNQGISRNVSTYGRGKKGDNVSMVNVQVDNLKRQGGPMLGSLSLDDTAAYYMLFCQTFIKLLKVEKLLMRVLIPEALHKVTLEKIIASSLAALVYDGENLSNNVRAAVTAKHFMPILAVLRCSDLFYTIGPQFISLFKGLESDPASKVVSIKHFLQMTLYQSLQSLEEFLTLPPSEKATDLPPDGTIHEVTSSTIQLLQKMCDCKEFVGRVFLKYDPNKFLDSLSPGNMACYAFYARVLKGLMAVIDQKARGYDLESLQAIFRLNNINYMRKQAGRETEVCATVSASWPSFIDDLDREISKQRSIYQRGFSKLLSLMNDLTNTPSKGAELSKSSKSAIKERFRGVNNELDELHRAQQRYSVPDFTLRQTLISSNIELLLESYDNFLKRHSSALQQFQNPDKYLKYTLADFEKVMKSFFDQSA